MKTITEMWKNDSLVRFRVRNTLTLDDYCVLHVATFKDGQPECFRAVKLEDGLLTDCMLKGYESFYVVLSTKGEAAMLAHLREPHLRSILSDAYRKKWESKWENDPVQFGEG